MWRPVSRFFVGRQLSEGETPVVTSDEYQKLDAIGLAELVRRGDVRPMELLHLAVRCKEGVNEKINAVSTSLTDYAEKQIHSGLPGGAFKGVPFLLKDQIDVRGLPTRRAARLLENHVAMGDATVVARLREAGFTFFGKTNMPELGLNVTTEPKLTGPTINPWNREFSAGGSSGGSAAAVAAGMCPVASATDGGGSIRIPASCCGVFGLKPSRGRIPFGPDHGEGWGGMTAHGVVTRSVRDTAALLDVLSGPEVGDPYYLEAAPGTFLQATRMKPGRLKIGVVNTPPADTVVHKECRDAVTDAVSLLAGLDHECIETSYPIDGAELRDAAGTIIRAKVYAGLEQIADERGSPLTRDDVEAATWMIHAAGKDTSVRDYTEAIETIHRIGRQMGEFMSRFDVVLSPSLAEPPIKLGVLNTETTDGRALFDRMRRFSPFCNLFNATGQPAMSVPLYWGSHNLPIGVQFSARFGDEITLLKLAAQLEAARPWWQRYRWLQL